MIVNNEEVRNKLAQDILIRLGGNMIDIELDPDTLQKCIQLAINKLKQRGDAFVEESLVLLTIKRDTKEYILPSEIVYIEKIYRHGWGRGQGSMSAGNMDPFAYSWTNIYTASLYGAGKVGGLTTYELNTNYLKTAGKMFGAYMNYAFNPATKKLILAENPRTDEETILLHAYVDKPEYMVIQDRFAGLWIENWAVAEAKEIVGEMRSKFSSVPGPLSQTQMNGQQLKQEAQKMKEDLEKELKHFVPAGDAGYLMPFSG